MWRAFFLAVGGLLLVTGIESLVLDHAVLVTDSKLGQAAAATTESGGWGFEVDDPVEKKIKPPEWAPWSMLSSGAVIMLYALSSKVYGV